MNPPVNRSPESPRSSKKQPLDKSKQASAPIEPPAEVSEEKSPATSQPSSASIEPLAEVSEEKYPATSQQSSVSAVASGNQPEESTPTTTPIESSPQAEVTPTGLPTAEATEHPPRQGPIPQPSHPRQYRAIGLIEGKYQRSEDQLTQGLLVTSEGTAIDSVLLGRVISLIKNHLDLEKSHLWVVYPRTRQADDQLHVQIVGVWEPETLSKDPITGIAETPAEPDENVHSGYFSLRGEVIYASYEKEVVIIKIRQSPKKEGERPKFFKLKLKGKLPEKPVGHFWDLDVQLEGDALTIQQGTDLGFLAKKKPFQKFPGKRPPGQGGPRKFPSDSRPTPLGKTPERPPGKPRPPLPKPIKGNKGQE